MREVVLLGGGQAHLVALRRWTRRPLAGARLRLVNPTPEVIYSGLLPAVVAGHAKREDATIPLSPLLAAAGGEFLAAAAVGIDSGRRCVQLSDGQEIGFDLLSVDVGASGSPDLPGAEHSLPLRPPGRFLPKMDRLGIDGSEGARIVMVGAGAAGFEISLALAHRLRRSEGGTHRLTLVSGRHGPLPGYPARVQQRAREELRRAGVRLLIGRAERIEPGEVWLDTGEREVADLVLTATGARAPAWLRGTGLPLDEAGFLTVGTTLQVIGHPCILAVGDVSVCPDRPWPRRGVLAVRAATVLAENLERQIEGRPLRTFVPPRYTLQLLSCGARRAIGAWGPWSVTGSWVWQIKQAIDRRFVASLRFPSEQRQAT